MGLVFLLAGGDRQTETGGLVKERRQTGDFLQIVSATIDLRISASLFARTARES